ncbi:MAG: hypothetical protein AABZ30_01260 [Myxococcota bacterium]
MKIQGPGDTPPASPTEAGGAEASAPVAATEPTREAAGVDALRALAEDLRTGRITSGQALDRLVERAVAQVAGAASSDTLERLRAALLDLATRDPILSEKLRRLDR